MTTTNKSFEDIETAYKVNKKDFNFGGGQVPVHRPHFWTYGDATGPMLIHGIVALDQNRSIQPAVLETGPEIENFPYGRWKKSFRQTFAQMAVAHILGSTNLTLACTTSWAIGRTTSRSEPSF